VTNGLDTSLLLDTQIVEHTNQAEARRLMSAYLDRLQDPGHHGLAEICFDRRAQALWDV
jgi:hypothetical protein